MVPDKCSEEQQHMSLSNPWGQHCMRRKCSRYRDSYHNIDSARGADLPAPAIRPMFSWALSLDGPGLDRYHPQRGPSSCGPRCPTSKSPHHPRHATRKHAHAFIGAARQPQNASLPCDASSSRPPRPCERKWSDSKPLFCVALYNANQISMQEQACVMATRWTPRPKVGYDCISKVSGPLAKEMTSKSC